MEQGLLQPVAEILGSCWDVGVRNEGEAVSTARVAVCNFQAEETRN